MEYGIWSSGLYNYRIPASMKQASIANELWEIRTLKILPILSDCLLYIEKTMQIGQNKISTDMSSGQ